ncbi:hypothetical protein AB8Q18_14040 [Neisseriaceae bacterium CLB008]
MAEHQPTSEHSADLMQLQALRQQGAIGDSAFAQLKAKLLSGNAQDVKGAQQDLHKLQQPTGHSPTPPKKGSGWLLKTFMVAIVAVIVTIVYLVMSLPKANEEEHITTQSPDEQVEILLPKGAQDVVPTFTPGESINEAFKAKQAAQDGLLAKDGEAQVATSEPQNTSPAALMQPSQNGKNGGNAQKATNAAKEADPINQLVQQKQQEARNKPAQKKAVTSENIDNLF